MLHVSKAGMMELPPCCSCQRDLLGTVTLHCNKAVLFFHSPREQGRLNNLSKASKYGFLPQSWKLNVLLCPSTGSLKNQFYVSNKAAHWSGVFHGQLGALRLSKSPSLQGYLMYLLPPCLDPESACPSFPLHVLCQGLPRWHCGTVQGKVRQSRAVHRYFPSLLLSLCLASASC